MTDAGIETEARVHVGGLHIAPELHQFVEREALPGSGLRSIDFWSGFERLVVELGPTGRALLAERDRLQADLDDWYRAHGARPWDATAYLTHLERIGYLLPEPAEVTVTTRNVDVEVAELAGPQLVVPITNARYALNAVNARWGSLYDAFYGTDALPGSARPGGYDRERGAQIVTAVRPSLTSSSPSQGRATPMRSATPSWTARSRSLLRKSPRRSRTRPPSAAGGVIPRARRRYCSSATGCTGRCSSTRPRLSPGTMPPV